MDEWVHCNLCGQTLSKGVLFFLTTCSHIFCGRCKDKGTDPCAICKSPCKAKELNDKLDASMQTYFSTPIKQLGKLVETSKFQAQHRTMLIGHLKKKIEQQGKMLKSAEEYFKKQNEENKQLKYDQSVLKKYINSYKSHSSDHSHHRPTTPRQLSCSPNMMSPRHSRSCAPSPMTTGGHQSHTGSKWGLNSPVSHGATPTRHLGEIQNIPSDMNRTSIRLRPAEGVMGTPSPRSIQKSGSAYPSRMNSPLVISSDPGYRQSATSNPQRQATLWPNQMQGAKFWPTPPCTPQRPTSSSSARSIYFSKIESTPPCTPQRPSHVSRPPTRESTPMLKFHKTNFR